ncbi:profilin [Aspergillus ochraceoroseus]|uniref:Profilin n=1 Tax=Aspergillus ochraceoroseus TaxID=138278 RepID=A0A0F8UEG7_9EURO|nr:profilin [Aspergillus ochraceoroseus]
MGAHSAIWQGYVDSSLMGSGQFDKAAILSHDFSGVEASSPGFTISQEEITGLAAAFRDTGYAMQHGFHIGGEKFLAIKADERSLYGKKGKEGAIVVRAVSCIMVGHHTEAVQTTNAAAAIEKGTLDIGSHHGDVTRELADCEEEIAEEDEEAVELDQEARERPAQEDEEDSANKGSGAFEFLAAREESERFFKADYQSQPDEEQDLEVG